MNVRIQLRLTALYAGLLAATLAVLGTFLVLQLDSDLHREIDEEARRSSAAIADALTDDGIPPSSRRGHDLADGFEDAASAFLPDSRAAAQLLDGNGGLLLHRGRFSTAEPLVGPDRLVGAAGRGQPFTMRFGRERQRYRVLVSDLNDERSARYLVVAVSLGRAEHDVRELLALLLFAGPVALILTALAGSWVAHRALRPVAQMIADTEAIRTDNLHERVALPAARDELRRLAETLNAMLGRIEEGSKQQRRLIADASHELRTPLAVMRSEVDVSLMADELPPSARELLVSLREEVDQMSRLVVNLLTLASADEGGLELLTEEVDLRREVDRAAQQLRQRADASGVRLDTGGEAGAVRADRQRLHLALVNLIENAVKFTGPGGSVRVETWTRDGEAGVSVADDGPGVSAADGERLFDRFYRADSARADGVDGSGLGLAICREVAVAHGGRVWVDSRLGKGSTFFLALPSWRALSTEDRGEVPHPGDQR